jgi:hypothetical protein
VELAFDPLELAHRRGPRRPRARQAGATGGRAVCTPTASKTSAQASGDLAIDRSLACSRRAARERLAICGVSSVESAPTLSAPRPDSLVLCGAASLETHRSARARRGLRHVPGRERQFRAGSATSTAATPPPCSTAMGSRPWGSVKEWGAVARRDAKFPQIVGRRARGWPFLRRRSSDSGEHGSGSTERNASPRPEPGRTVRQRGAHT